MSYLSNLHLTNFSHLSLSPLPTLTKTPKLLYASVYKPASLLPSVISILSLFLYCFIDVWLTQHIDHHFNRPLPRLPFPARWWFQPDQEASKRDEVNRRKDGRREAEDGSHAAEAISKKAVDGCQSGFGADLYTGC